MRYAFLVYKHSLAKHKMNRSF